MGEKRIQNLIRTALRILLPIATLLWLGFIISNSLQTGEQSSAQSETVVVAVQKVAKVIAPNSKIATATGESYDMLHLAIRNLAHIVQFMVLGALTCWTYFSYTFKMSYIHIFVFLVILVPVVDEFIQSFVADRGSELLDVLMDTFGAVMGFLLAGLSVAIGVLIYKIRKQNKRDKTEREIPAGHPAYRK